MLTLREGEGRERGGRGEGEGEGEREGRDRERERERERGRESMRLCNMYILLLSDTHTGCGYLSILNHALQYYTYNCSCQE